MDRYIKQMYETYRRDADLFKVQIGISLLLLKILLVWVQLAQAG